MEHELSGEALAKADRSCLTRFDLQRLQSSIVAEMGRATTTSDDLHWLGVDLARVEKLLTKGTLFYSDLTRPLLFRLVQIRQVRGWHFQSSKNNFVRLLERSEVR